MDKPTTAAEFDTLYRSIKPSHPRPRNPEYALKREDYDTAKDYHMAMAAALDDYYKDKELHEQSMKEYYAEAQKVNNMFREFCDDEYGLGELPEVVRNEIHDLAYEDGHSAGMYEVFNCMEKYANLARVAYKEGKKG